MSNRFLVALSLILVSGCVTSPPSHPGNLCEIFREKGGWFNDAADAEDQWNSPIPVMMSIMYQESAFVAKAKPPRRYLLGIIPWKRLSSAYGYSQAKTGTWEWYIKSSGNRGADRDDFEDAVDFIGWYNKTTGKINGVAPTDARNLYLAYHEGHGGFKRQTYKKKKWLVDVADRVSRRSMRYDNQLRGCRKELETNWFFRLFT